MQIDRKSNISDKRKKRFSIISGNIFLSGYLTVLLATIKSGKCNPIIFSILAILHVITYLYTEYNENGTPNLFKMLNRTPEGVLVLTLPFSYSAYILTYFLIDDIRFKKTVADYAAIYVIFLMFWLLLASGNIFGPYFAFIGFIDLAPPRILYYFPEISEQPFAFVPVLMITAIFWILAYISHILLIISLYTGKEFTHMKSDPKNGIESDRASQKPLEILGIPRVIESIKAVRISINNEAIRRNIRLQKEINGKKLAIQIFIELVFFVAIFLVININGPFIFADLILGNIISG